MTSHAYQSTSPAFCFSSPWSLGNTVRTEAAQRARLVEVAPAGTPEAGTPAAGTPAAGTPVSQVVENFAVVEQAVLILGEEIPLGPGEGVTFGPNVVHTFRNTGDEPAVLLLIGDAPPDQPVFRFVAAAAGERRLRRRPRRRR